MIVSIPLVADFYPRLKGMGLKVRINTTIVTKPRNLRRPSNGTQ
jgi:hypothetical protein